MHGFEKKRQIYSTTLWAIMKLIIEFQAKYLGSLNLFGGGVQLVSWLAKNQRTQSKLIYFVIAMNESLS